MRMKRFPLLPLTFFVLAIACSKQGEGERCNLVNSSGDCEDGLHCVAVRGNNGCSASNQAFDCLPNICCPPAPQRSVVAQCNQYQYGEGTGTGGSSAGGGSGIGTETGGSEAGGSDTGGTTGAGGVTGIGTDTGGAEAGGSDTGGTPSTGTGP